MIEYGVLLREIAGFRAKIDEMIDRVFEVTAQVKEMTRDRDTNVLVHGLPTQVETISSCKSFFFIFRTMKISIF